MPLDLIRVRRVDDYPTKRPGVTLFAVKGETVEESPRYMTLKTFKPLVAALCLRAAAVEQLVWIGWKDGRPEPFSADKQADIVTCELDQTKFRYEDGAHV